jgi:hypothetical protein
LFSKAYSQAAMKQVIKIMASVISSLCIAILLFEISYRYYWIDFHQTEFNLLNPSFPKKGKNKILILGDSFSASPDSYCKQLRDSLPQIEIVNAAVSGTGIQEANTLLDYRVTQVKPALVIYQVYVGNDLTDIAKPVNVRKQSLTRAAFWYLSNHLLGLRYLNYKAGQWYHLVFKGNLEAKEETEKSFSVTDFSTREKVYLQSDAELPAKYILVKDKNDEVLAKYLHEMQSMIDYLHSKNIPLMLLILPHCSQVSDYYANHFKELGASMSAHLYEGAADYPFYKLLKNQVKNHPNVSICQPLENFRNLDSAAFHLYYENDIHLTKKGQSLLGHYLLPMVKQQMKFTGID